MGSSKCYRARWIAVVSSSFRVGDTWGREKGCREAEISAPLASLEDEEPATVSCARGCRLQFITLLGGAAAVVSLTRPRFCAADRGTDMQCARAPGNRAVLWLARSRRSRYRFPMHGPHGCARELFP